MSKIRYNIRVRSSSRGVRKQDFIWNKFPHRPGSIAENLDAAVKQQYTHLGFGERSYPKGTTKYPVYGIRWKGCGIDGTDIVGMWCPQTKAVVLIKVERAEE